MNEEQVRKIIQEEIQKIFNKSDFSDFFNGSRFDFERDMKIFDGRNVRVGGNVGTKIGTASDQKLGFYGAAPVVQPTVASDTLANLYTALRSNGVIG